MSSPATENVYDVIIIGTGPIGQTAADRTRAGGLSVAAVERELVGGECSYWACIPSKAMLRPVVAVADARRVAGALQAVTRPVDVPATFSRRDRLVTDWNDEGQANFLKSIGAELIRGHGRLDGARRVAVETPDGATISLTARHAVAICTGSRPDLPELPGLAEVRPWTNREATNVRDIPSRVLLVGGSAVGTEMGQFYAGMGAQVTIVQRAGRRAGRPGAVRAGCRRPHRGHPGQSRKVGQAVVTLDDGSQVETDVVILAPTAPRERRDPAWRPPGCS